MYTLHSSSLVRLNAVLKEMYSDVEQHALKGQIDLLDEISELLDQIRLHRTKKMWMNKDELNQDVSEVIQHYRNFQQRIRLASKVA